MSNTKHQQSALISLRTTALVTLLTALFLLAGCSPPAPTENTSEPTSEVSASAPKAEAQIATSPLQLGADVDVQTVASVMEHDDVFLLDVREQGEYDAGHISGNTLIPVGAIADRLAEIPKNKEVIIYCHSGVRSAKVFNFLQEQGYTNIHNMQGGIVAWQSAGFDVEQ